MYEQNSAEREAEQILQAEFRRIQAENCPQGEECAVHHRVNEAYFNEQTKSVRVVTYLDQHVVITDNNPEIRYPALMFKVLAGAAVKADIPDRWMTTVFSLRGDGVIADMEDMDPAMVRSMVRFRRTHDRWEGVQQFHQAVIQAVQSGMV